MTLHHALLFLGLFTIAALVAVTLSMIWLSFRLRAHEHRDRALPAGKLPLNPELWDGKNALDHAEAASREVSR